MEISELEHNSSISISEFNNRYNELKNELNNVKVKVQSITTVISILNDDFSTLTANLPDRNEWWSIRPKDVAVTSLKAGWKNNYGIVLTGEGCIWFEPVEGTNFKLMDNNGLYLFANYDGTLTEVSFNEATVWTGKREWVSGKSYYSFYSEQDDLWLTTSGTSANSPVIAGTEKTLWTIEEGDAPLQLFLYSLAEDAFPPVPTSLDLNGMTEYLRRPLQVPPFLDITILNGAIKPREGLIWDNDYFINISDHSIMRLNNVVVDLSSTEHYMKFGNPRKITVMNIAADGELHLGENSSIITASFPSESFDDFNYYGGAIYAQTSTTKIYLEGGALYGPIIENSPASYNVYIAAPLQGELNFFVPQYLRTANTIVAKKYNNYNISVMDLSKIKFAGVTDYTANVSSGGYVYLMPVSDMGDIEYFISGDNDAALRNYQSSIQYENDTPSIRYRIGYIHYAAKRYVESLGSMLTAAEENGNDLHLLLALGNVLSLRDDNFAAEGYFERFMDEFDRIRIREKVILPQVDPDHNDLVENYMHAANNYGVALSKLALRTGNSAQNAKAMVYFSESSRAWDALTRNQTTLVRNEGSNLAAQNIKYMSYPQSIFEPAMYYDIPRTLQDEEILKQAAQR